MVLSLFVAAAVITGGSTPGLSQAPQTQAGPPPVDCSRALSNQSLAQFCQGRQEARTAEGLEDETARARRLDGAATMLRRAASGTRDDLVKAAALDELARVLDGDHLDRPNDEELVLRELMGVVPGDLQPMFRLARLQERQGFIDAAEMTLVSARQLEPETIEPYQQLAQFYARLSLAIQRRQRQLEPRTAPPVSGQPDDQGVYTIGGDLPPPKKVADVRPAFPDAAQAAGLAGVVIAEIVVDETGQVANAHLVQQIPLLEEAALAAVRQWRFDPVIVDGRPVPVRMTVTVNFTLKRP
jgi:TonB family protein